LIAAIAAVAIPTAIAILATVPACAQELGEQPPGFSTGEPVSSFYTIDSRPVRARMSLEGSTRLQGIAPLTIPGDLTGPFLVKVEATGYEMQRGVLRFPGAGGPLEVNPDDETGGVLLPALLWPGLGEIRRGQGDGLRGAGFAAAGGVGVSGVVLAELRRRDAEENADRATSEQGNAPGLPERTALQLEAARETAVADRARAARRDWAIVSAAVWGLSLLDTYRLTPRMAGTELAHNDLTLNLKPLSRGQAFMRSIVPGLGQYYTGRRTAGAFYFFGGLAAGTVFLASEHRYSEAANRLAAVQALYDDPFADPESLALIRPAVEEETEKADDARKQRNLTAAIAAGVWGANLLDAVLATPSPPDDDQAGKRPTTRVGSPTPDLTFTLDLAQNPRLGMRCRFW
jgi:hypothetical protein